MLFIPKNPLIFYRTNNENDLVAIFVTSFNKSLVIELEPVNTTAHLVQMANVSYIAYCQNSGVQSLLHQTYKCSDINSPIEISGVLHRKLRVRV